MFKSLKNNKAVRFTFNLLPDFIKNVIWDVLCLPIFLSNVTRARQEYSLQLDMGDQEKLDFIPNLKIAIVVHVFNKSFIDELLDSLNEMPTDFALFITVTDETIKKETEFELAQKLKRNSIKIRIIVSENKGRNFGPFLLHLGRELFEDYDLLLHLHSKRDQKRPLLRNWGRYLIKNLMGSQQNITDIIALFSRDPEVGIVYPTNYYRLGEVSKWQDFDFDVKQYLREINLPLDIPEIFDYPAGGMFWARTEALKEILTYKYSNNNFAIEENFQSDKNFRFPWLLERLVGIEPMNHGFKSVFRSNGVFTQDNRFIPARFRNLPKYFFSKIRS
jgi:lipopolysaccharide biosynthesis protein